MKKQITTTILGILMIAGVIAMYGGDTITFETNLTNPVYTVLGNGSSLEGLNITFDNENITISPALNYKPDNFTLIFFDNLTKEIIKEVRRGSSGSGRWIEKIIDNNITVYVPEYINNTETIEVEKIVDETIIIYKDYELWHVLLGIVTGMIFVWIIMRSVNKSSKEEKNG